MISMSDYRQQWFGNIRGDVLAGIVVALALIPEAIAFSIIAKFHSVRGAKIDSDASLL